MTRLYRAILMVVVFPLILTGLLYFFTRLRQPVELSMSPVQSNSTVYFDITKRQALAGEMRLYGGELYDIVPDESVPYAVVTSLSELLVPEYENESNYVGTFVFYLNLPTSYEYGVIIPAYFCEYQLIVNGELIGQTQTFLGTHPRYTSPEYYAFPDSDTGKYEVILKVCTPSNFSSDKRDVILFGDAELLEFTQNVRTYISLAFECFLLFSTIFCAIQIYTIRTDSLHLAFFLCALSASLNIFFAADNIIMKFIPALPYQLGVILRSLSSPLFGAALIYLAYTMFKDYFPTKLVNVFVAIQIIPLLNLLCFEQVDILVTVSSLITTLPYAICMYIFIFSYERREQFSLSYGIAVLLVETSILTSFATADMLVPARYTYSLGLVAFSVIELVILAKRYSAQYDNEMFYASELTNQLEAMQASENAFLNAQMKPHFLYNTLNTIADLCVTDAPKAKSLIEALSEYLKLILSLDNMQETVSLKRELEIAERYMEIEGRRFPSIQFYKDYPLRMPTVYMPPIVIQPLIENAIKHGVRKLDRPGMITLRIEENNNTVTFLVSDNGDGMDQETINKLFERPKENKSIGIYNIDKRLRNKYGRGLVVESTKGLGTSVSFTIPKGDIARN